MMSRQSSDAYAAAVGASHRTQLRKRRSDADDEDRCVRAASPSPFSSQMQTHVSAASSSPMMPRNSLELRAFGLEDRADAVISSNAADWSLKNLSQWRQEMVQRSPHAVGATAPTASSSKAYIAERQREYKQQMLRAARAPPPPPSSQ